MVMKKILVHILFGKRYYFIIINLTFICSLKHIFRVTYESYFILILYKLYKFWPPQKNSYIFVHCSLDFMPAYFHLCIMVYIELLEA